MTCTTCSARTDTRKARKAHSLATGHDAYAPAQQVPVARTSRDDAVDAMVARGWSREFAEAYVPMTTVEAQARGLQVEAYRSELGGLAR